MKAQHNNQNTGNTTMIKVAYAEDHEMVRKSVIDYIEKLGGVKVIIQAGNGKDLVTAIADADEKPDVCLVDIVMPKLNGFETVAAIKKRWDNIRILVLSGYLTEEYLIKMILSGADGYLTKNVDPAEIVRAVTEVHKYGLYNTELFTAKFMFDVRNRMIELPHLTPKEVQLLKLSIEDKTFEEIAVLMNTTAKSIEGHRNRLYTKLGIKTRAGLALYAIKYGHVAIDSGINPL